MFTGAARPLQNTIVVFVRVFVSIVVPALCCIHIPYKLQTHFPPLELHLDVQSPQGHQVSCRKLDHLPRDGIEGLAVHLSQTGDEDVRGNC